MRRLFVAAVFLAVGAASAVAGTKAEVPVQNPTYFEALRYEYFPFEGPGHFRTTAIPGGCNISIVWTAGKRKRPFRFSLINPARGLKTTLAVEDGTAEGSGTLNFARLDLFVLEMEGKGKWYTLVIRKKGGGCLDDPPVIKSDT